MNSGKERRETRNGFCPVLKWSHGHDAMIKKNSRCVIPFKFTQSRIVTSTFDFESSETKSTLFCSKKGQIDLFCDKKGFDRTRTRTSSRVESYSTQICDPDLQSPHLSTISLSSSQNAEIFPVVRSVNAYPWGQSK